jgi:Skp1 family, dimerisation domain
MAEQIKKMSVDEIRAHFGMKNDFTPEAAAQLNKDFPWTYEYIC